MIRVVIVDDHKLMREGLKAMLAKTSDIQVVGEAANGLEAVDLALQTTPDIMLMDLAMPEVDGLKASRQITELDKGIRIIVISGHSDQASLREALRSGVRGYVVKSAGPQELPLAIRAVHKGEMYFSPEVFSLLSEELVKQKSTHP
ncbi:MAG: response regulator transcription factor [Acidobacteriota bacterium]